MDAWAADRGLAVGSAELAVAVAASLSEAGLQGALGEGLKKHEDTALGLLPVLLEGYLRGDAVCAALLTQLPEQAHPLPPAASLEDELRLSPMNVFPERLLPADALPPIAPPGPVYASVPSPALLRAGMAALLGRLSHLGPAAREGAVRCGAAAARAAELDEGSWRLLLLLLHRCAASGTPGAVAVVRALRRREDCPALQLAAAALLLRYKGVEEEPPKGKEDA